MAIFQTQFSLAMNEAHFTLFGYVNKQNCRIWRSKNRQVIEERPLHPEKNHYLVCSLVQGVIGLYFFKNDD